MHLVIAVPTTPVPLPVCGDMPEVSIPIDPSKAKNDKTEEPAESIFGSGASGYKSREKEVTISFPLEDEATLSGLTITSENVISITASAYADDEPVAEAVAVVSDLSLFHLVSVNITPCHGK